MRLTITYPTISVSLSRVEPDHTFLTIKIHEHGFLQANGEIELSIMTREPEKLAEAFAKAADLLISAPVHA